MTGASNRRMKKEFSVNYLPISLSVRMSAMVADPPISRNGLIHFSFTTSFTGFHGILMI
jgi:hypothetical protein